MFSTTALRYSCVQYFAVHVFDMQVFMRAVQQYSELHACSTQTFMRAGVHAYRRSCMHAFMCLNCMHSALQFAPAQLAASLPRDGQRAPRPRSGHRAPEAHVSRLKLHNFSDLFRRSEL